MAKPSIMGTGHPDDFQTPYYGVNTLLPYLHFPSKIWECACGTGNLVTVFTELGFSCVGTDIKQGTDFLTYNPSHKYDYIITNPPYSLKDQFIARCYELGKPFALLMPLTALEGQKRQELYRKNGLQIIIPNRRINFETPSGRGSGSWFLTAWFTWGLNLPSDLLFVELDKKTLFS